MANNLKEDSQLEIVCTSEMHIQSAEAQKYAKSRLSGMLSMPEFTEKDFLFREFQIGLQDFN